MMCSSVNLLRFISVLLDRELYLKLEELQGSTSEAAMFSSRNPKAVSTAFSIDPVVGYCSRDVR